MNKLLITCFFIGCTLKCFSTCIVIYIADQDHIYVAADSRRSFIFNHQGANHQFESVCKIHNVGNDYFAIAGFDDGALLTEATRSLQQNSVLDTAIKFFGETMVKHYDQLMTKTKRYYPGEFKHFLKAGLAKVSFFGFHNGEPGITNIEFMCSLDKKNNVISTCRIHHASNITVIGISQDITNAKPEELPSSETREQNPELFVESLVKIEVKMDPLAVSEPIDLLLLKPNGPIWIRKNRNAASY